MTRARENRAFCQPMAAELAPTKDVLMPKMDPCDRCPVGILSQGLPVVLTHEVHALSKS